MPLTFSNSRLYVIISHILAIPGARRLLDLSLTSREAAVRPISTHLLSGMLR